MEADWEIEIGPGAPIIDAIWPGFVDLQKHPELACCLPETANLPALSEALVQLNRAKSPVWTAKCDVWTVLNADELDPYELDATPEEANHACACYIDLLAKSSKQWETPEKAVQWSKTVCARLHAPAMSGCRVDLVIRRASIVPACIDIGITAYLTACGKTAEAAHHRLSKAVHAFAGAFLPASTVE